MSASVKLRPVLLAAVAALLLALVSPTLDRATAEPNNGGGKVTCSGGADPGDVQEFHTYFYVNGKLTGQTTNKKICGKDGNWHDVAPLLSQSGITAVGSATIRPAG
jgi:hypothetical protein